MNGCGCVPKHLYLQKSGGGLDLAKGNCLPIPGRQSEPQQVFNIEKIQTFEVVMVKYAR